jgi:type II secretory pathway pseudopilin PulG
MAPAARRRPLFDRSGISLVEVVLAVGLVAVILIGAAAMFAQATRVTARARRDMVALMLAVQKMEQLRGLTWEVAGSGSANPGAPLSDTTTDLSGARPLLGGPGLSVAPPNVLATNTPFYVDFAGPDGAWVGTGTVPLRGAVFVRRWSVSTVPGAPDTLRFEVVVAPADVTGAPGAVEHADRTIRLIGARTRVVR